MTLPHLSPQETESPQARFPAKEGVAKKAKNKFVDYVIDPKLYLPVALLTLAFLGTMTYSYFERDIAQRIAYILSKEENFQQRNSLGDLEKLPNTLFISIRDRLSQDEQFVNSIIAHEQFQQAIAPFGPNDIAEQVLSKRIENYFQESNNSTESIIDAILRSKGDAREKLRKQIKYLIHEELDILAAVELEYSRVDSIFRKTFELKGLPSAAVSARNNITAKMEFVAEKNQQIFIKITSRYNFYHTAHGKYRQSEDVRRSFRIIGVQEKEVKSDDVMSITDVVDFKEASGVQFLEVSLLPIKGIGEDDSLTVDVTIIVKNELPSRRSPTENGGEAMAASQEKELPSD